MNITPQCRQQKIALVDLEVERVKLNNLKNFSEPSNSGELEYISYKFYNRYVASFSINIKGDYYGLFYIAEKNVQRNKFYYVCEQTIEQIRETLQADRDFQIL